MIGMSRRTLERLPLYLNYLKSIDNENMPKYISATAIAEALGLNDVQVRKDLALLPTAGMPKKGYVAQKLLDDIKGALGHNDTNRAVIVGAGRLGKALLGYGGFEEYGLDILAAFDNDDLLINTQCEGKKILHIDKLKSICVRMNVTIGIITVPASCAQDICDMLIQGGVRVIWNFAPICLNAPDHVYVHNENVAATLAVLSRHLILNKQNG